MKKYSSLILFVLFFLTGCLDDPAPEPPLSDSIRSYFIIYNFLTEPFDVSWDINDSIVESAHSYGTSVLGNTILDQVSQDIAFTVKESGTDRVIESEVFGLQQNQFNIVSIMGTENIPYLLIDSLSLAAPSINMIKLRFMQTVMELGPIDIYIGGDTPEHKVFSSIAFSDITDYLETTEKNLWEAIIITPYNMPPSDSTILSYTANNVFVPNHVYLGVLGHISYSTSSFLQLQLYDQTSK